MTPFAIDGPALISFSGGRTSAYMLRRILDEGLRPDVYVVFADTGKERAETYDFVRACASAWQVPIAWVHRPGYFLQLIRDKQFLPNPVMRFCTQELKIKPARDFMRARGFDHWTNVLGLRKDEPNQKRIARMRNLHDPEYDVALPLLENGTTALDVAAFWRAQPFDLALRSYEGNCDLCFLKGLAKRRAIARDRPDLLQWWIDREREIGAHFRADQPGYAELLDQGDLFADTDDTTIAACYCNPDD